MTPSSNQVSLVDRLRATGCPRDHVRHDSQCFINPDGPEAAARIEGLEGVLESAAAKFREYETLHLAKVRPHIQGVHWSAKIVGENEAARGKAECNREMAEMCEAALSALRPDDQP